VTDRFSAVQLSGRSRGRWAGALDSAPRREDGVRWGQRGAAETL